MPVHNQFITDATTKLQSPDGLMHVGPCLPIEIHVPAAIAAVLTQGGQPVPAPITGMALIDTGATFASVHEPHLQTLGLNPVGTAQMGTANGPVQQNVYPASLVFPAQSLSLNLQQVVGVNLTGQTVPLQPPQDLIALIGRNVLRSWVLTYNGLAGMWTISW